MLLAAITQDRTACETASRQLGFLVEDDVPVSKAVHMPC